MTEHENDSPVDPFEPLDALEQKLDEADAADAPETAEEIARLLGRSLDEIDGGSGSVAS
jgi:hypothetical protein